MVVDCTVVAVQKARLESSAQVRWRKINSIRETMRSAKAESHVDQEAEAQSFGVLLLLLTDYMCQLLGVRIAIGFSCGSWPFRRGSCLNHI